VVGDFSPGDSGDPFFRWFDNDPFLVGILSTQSTINQVAGGELLTALIIQALNQSSCPGH
jgi:hypothetical protein